MRKVAFWTVTLLMLAAVVYVAWYAYAPRRTYAPDPAEAAAGEADFDERAPADPTPAPVTAAAESAPPDPALLPAHPIPYDQLDRPSPSRTAPQTPPQERSTDDKTIFY